MSQNEEAADVPDIQNMPIETRMDLCEAAMGEVLSSLEHAADAISRIETFLFPLIKTLKDNDRLSLEEWDMARKGLQEYDNLHEYWHNGTKIDPNAAPVPPTPSH